MRKLRRSKANLLAESRFQSSSLALTCSPTSLGITKPQCPIRMEIMGGGGGAGQQTRRQLTRKSTCPLHAVRRKDRTGHVCTEAFQPGGIFSSPYMVVGLSGLPITFRGVGGGVSKKEVAQEHGGDERISWRNWNGKGRKGTAPGEVPGSQCLRVLSVGMSLRQPPREGPPEPGKDRGKSADQGAFQPGCTRGSFSVSPY